MSAESGRSETIIQVNKGEIASSPQMLPDGEHVLFTLGAQGQEIDLDRQRNWDQARIVVQSLKSGDRKVVFDGGYDARYSPTGHSCTRSVQRCGRGHSTCHGFRSPGRPVSIVDGVSNA